MVYPLNIIFYVKGLQVTVKINKNWLIDNSKIYKAN